jgi:shikimate kinase
MCIILCGLPACGKSYFAKKFSAFKGCPYLDLDLLVKDFYHETPRQIYQKQGQEALRVCEGNVLANLQFPWGVLALGGGTLMTESNALKVKAIGTLVYLKLEMVVVKKRLMKRRQKPLFLHQFDEIAPKRIKIYEKYADVTLDISQLSEHEALLELEKIYG